ncbi:MAG: hypothetical protein K1X67_25465 [Fimbriimonadaceae bacterium]|nr:hypothetical protein [Fimbriimonadaceae bacterium]
MRKFFPLASIAALAFAATAQAQRPAPIAIGTQTIQKVSALRAAPVYSNGRIGEWVSLQNGQTPQVASYINAYDATNTDPASVGFAISQEFYGPTSCGTAYGPGYNWYFGWGYNSPWQIDDIILNPPTSAKTASFYQNLLFWNPGGDPNGPSGSARMVMIVGAGQGFNPLGAGLSAVALDFGTLAGGYYWFTGDLSTADFGYPLPAVDGNLNVVAGTLDGSNNFVQSPGPAQTSYNTMSCDVSYGPLFPGTNPSAGTEFMYQDDNPANFIIDPSLEFYNNDFGAGFGKLQAVQGLFVDVNRPTISGTITLEDIDPATTRPVTTIRVVVTDGVNTVSDQVVTLGPNGEYEVLAPIANGTYNVYAVPTHWLIRSAQNLSFSGTSLTGVDISCENGDCDEDNEVGIGDYAILSAAYNSDPSAGNWDIRADLNHDDAVDIADYAIMSSNYGLTGD